MLKHHGNLLPYISGGTARVWLWSPNDEGYRGMDYSVGIGSDYWVNKRVSIGSEAYIRYVVYKGIRIGKRDKNFGSYPYIGTTVSLTILRVCYHFR